MISLGRFLKSKRRGSLLTKMRCITAGFLNGFCKFIHFFESRKTIYDFSKFDFQSKSFLLYVHTGEFLQQEIGLLKHFADNYFQVVVISDEKPKVNIEKIYWTQKNRYGRDFSAYRDLVRHLAIMPLSDFELILLNDSAIWDSDKLLELITKLRKENKGDIVFPTESKHPIWHVQPYFVYVNLNQAMMKRLSKSLNFISNGFFKRSIVINSEYQMGNTLKENSFNIKVLVNHELLISNMSDADRNFYIKSSVDQLNPTTDLWHLLGNFDLFFVKKSILAQKQDIRLKPGTIKEAFAILNRTVKS